MSSKSSLPLSLLSVLAAVTTGLHAAPSDSTPSGWVRQATGMFSLNQAWYDNWAKGGSDAITWELGFQGGAHLEREKFLWENKGKLAYGRTKLGDDASRKSADEWFLETVYTRKLGTWVNPFASASGRSQFTAGYTYADEPVETRTLNSEFFDPAYFFQTVGVGITPVKDLKERLGATIKETFSAEHGYADDPDTDGEVEDFRLEYGLTSITEYQRALMENILFNTRFEAFINFKGMSHVDMRWENKISAKVNKYVSVNLEYDMVYDRDQSVAAGMPIEPQSRESLAIGITFLTL